MDLYPAVTAAENRVPLERGARMRMTMTEVGERLNKSFTQLGWSFDDLTRSLKQLQRSRTQHG